MKVLMDTSVLLAAMLPDHVHHTFSQAWLAAAKLGRVHAVVSAHSLAELYAVLTRLPRTPRISGAEAVQLIRENLGAHSRVALNGDDYATLIESLAASGITGGAVYDAVIAKAAELANVDLLLTLNVAHFQRVWAAGSNRVVSPVAHSSP